MKTETFKKAQDLVNLYNGLKDYKENILKRTFNKIDGNNLKYDDIILNVRDKSSYWVCLISSIPTIEIKEKIFEEFKMLLVRLDMLVKKEMDKLDKEFDNLKDE